MRRRAAWGLTISLVIGTVAGPAAAGDPLPMVEVAAGVFVHRGDVSLMTAQNEGAVGNVGFIVGEESVAVVDTGGSAVEGAALLAAMRERTALPVGYVINTHMHPDHLFGNAAFRGAGPEGRDPRYVGHEALAEALASRAQYYLETNRAVLGEEAAGRRSTPWCPTLTVAQTR